ncbi:uncharacterized protein TM35_000011710 [Trypanosoma theileri]|uniref:Uncharacterized protein n=1 Tax=Trypanosoma theileri TaxID=67003 RepID=A0A1X0P8M5_9TRYP|nr:uncharacterized protein TM35_000011710 [Trypanosoma theileri]ORC93294.1 hypothetical protein TM35_000011710 [Trypanosoma theileri]
MADKKNISRRNAVPLIEFIQIILGQRNGEGKSKYPRRVNGRLVSDSLPKSQRSVSPVKLESTEEYEPCNIEPQPTEVVRRKRRKSISDEVPETTFVRSPFSCEILTKSSKGMYSSTYVDIDLSSLGLQRLTQGSVNSRKKGKSLVGIRCCYLRLGTSLVVSGCIVEVNITDSTAQVVPDKGLCLDVEWVHLNKLYQIPENITEIRKTVSEKVFAILQRESEHPVSENKKKFINVDEEIESTVSEIKNETTSEERHEFVEDIYKY